MSALICPRCGRQAENLAGGLCKRCRLEKLDLVEVPEVLHIRVCPVCEARFLHGEWSPGNVEDAVVAAVQDNLLVHRDARDVEIEVTPRQLSHSTWEVYAHVTAQVYGELVSEDHAVEVRVRRETCERCSRIAGGYFEGIVQVRAQDREPDQRETRRATRIAQEVVDRMYRSGDRGAFISKIETPPGGVDIYVGTHAAGRQIAKAITRELGGRVSESPQLVGRREGEDVYRVAYAVRLPRYRQGDIIELDDHVLEVKAVGKRVRAIDLRTGADYTGSPDELEDARKISERSRAEQAVVVYVEDNTIQILDPETYQTVEMLRPSFFMAREGEEVPAVHTPRGLFLLPEVPA